MRVAALFALVVLSAPGAWPDEPEYDWLLTFHNGDVVHCRLLGLKDTELTVQWEIAPGAPVSLGLATVGTLERARDVEPEQVEGRDVLRLHDGSALRGRALRFGLDSVEFDAPPLGRIVVETRRIVELARGEPDVPALEARKGEFVVATRDGNVLRGRLATNELGALVLKSEGITATIDYESVALVLFPHPANDPNAPPADEDAPGVQIKLRNGSILGGRDPRIEQGRLAFKLGTGHPVDVALDRLEQVSFMKYGELVGRSSVKSVLVWGRWADPGDEFRKTVNILKQQFEGRWEIKESMTDRIDRTLRRELFSVRALLIPEMEKLKKPMATEARELKPLLHSFVRSGGNVVVLGVQGEHLPWVKEAGLFDLKVAGQVDSQTITFLPAGERLKEGIGDSWEAVNATFGYSVLGGIDAEPLAATGGKAVVVGRRLGRGWFVCIGADYYMTNKEASRLLVNALTLK